jgi:ceramide glucosyltransferase
MMLRREALERLGGFHAFANYLIEDALLGRRIQALGLKLDTTLHAVENYNNAWTLWDFIRRHYRWGLMRRHLSLLHYSGEIFTDPIFFATLALATVPSLATLLVAVGVIAFKVGIDVLSIRTLRGRIYPLTPILIPFKDVLIGLIWWLPFFVNRVNWRGNRFRIGANTRIYPNGDHKSPRRGWPHEFINASMSKYRMAKSRLLAWGSRS